MAYRKIDTINKGISDIANDIKISRSTINHYLTDTASGLFEKQFGIKSYFESEKKDFNLAIYDIVKCCIEHFSILSEIHAKHHNLKDHISGNDILEYNRKLLHDIEMLQDFQTSLLKYHPSTKYASVMEKYYDEFINDLSIITYLCTDTSVTVDPLAFKKMLVNLEQTIWLYFLERQIGRSDSDTSLFSINHAIKDTIATLEKADELCHPITSDIDSKLQKLDNEQFKIKKDEIIEEYYSQVRDILTQSTVEDRFYEEINEHTTLFDNDYFENYRTSIILYSIGDSQEKIASLKHLLSLTDVYGRMFVSKIIKSIDKDLETINSFKNCINNHIAPDNACIEAIKLFFIPVYYKENKYIMQKNDFILSADIAKPFFDENFDEIIKTASTFTSRLIGNEYEAMVFPDNSQQVVKYLKWSLGFCKALEFNHDISMVNNLFVDNYAEIQSDKLYTKVKTEIDRAIVEKWTDSLFG